jgi:hypothetical protein
MVYYGDEAGINSPSVANSPGGLPEDDPYNRAPYPWSDETGNTAVYGPADNSLISYYTILGTLRKQNAALRTGSFETLLMGDITASTTDNNTFAFARQSGANKVVVVLNNGSTANTAVIPVGTYFTDGTTLTDSLGNSSFTDENSFAQHVVTGGNVTVTLAARTAAILVPFVPTAATANIAGRITLPNGAGLGRVNIEVQNINTGEIYKAQTDGSGYYRVEGRLVGNQYVVTPSRRLYSFTPKTELFTLLEDREDLNFTARRR